MRSSTNHLRRHLLLAGIAALAAAPALFALSRKNYLLFHSLIELFSVVVAFGAFTVAWNARRTIENGYLLFLGLAMPFVGTIDLVHTLAFRGMGVFPGRDANAATQLWIAARGLESLALVAAPLLVARRVRIGPALLGLAVVTGALLAAIFAGAFPDCFVEGSGLTPFKKSAEYVIIAALVVALWLFRRIRGRFEADVFLLLALALALTAVAEASFTLYRDVTGIANMTGHLLKLAAFLLIYRALVVTGIVRPLDLLYRALKESEAALQRENAVLAAYQQDLEAKNRELAALNERKNELLGIAAHDIRSPVSVIRMYASLLSQRLGACADPESRTFIEAIQRTSGKTLTLVGDVLDFAAIEHGTLSLQRRPVPLRALVAEALAPHAALARGKGIEVRLDPGDDTAVNADPLRIDQALANLVSNAVKFSPEGTTVTVRLLQSDGWAGIAVRDQGPGIAATDIPKIFAPFQRAAVQGAAGEASTGLGLAIVQKIAAAHGGRIEVESEPGKGSTFTLWLPILEGEEAGRGERI